MNERLANFGQFSIRSNAEVLALLQEEKAHLLKRLAEVDKSIDAYMGEGTSIKWTEKSLTCLAEFMRPATSSEILTCLFRENPEKLYDKKRRRNYMTGLSVALNNLVSTNAIKKIDVRGMHGYFYALNDWYENDKLMSTYEEKFRRQVGNISLNTE